MTESMNETFLANKPQSPGALIKAGRELAGIHLDVLCVNLKVSVKQLEALEADQFDRLSGPVFARALAAKVCRFVKMDPEPVLALMPATTNGLKPLNIIGADQASSYQAHHVSPRVSLSSWGGKLWLLALLLCLFAVLFGTNWFTPLLNLSGSADVAEVVPMMPPVQEPVATDASQAELPKAMVFDSANPAPAPSSTPAIVPTSSNVPSETTK
jgi:cytoskeleton protein RodZ